MEKIIHLAAFVIAINFASFSIAQNIVPNPDLELYTTCPTGVAQVDNLVGWNKIPNHTGSADCINACNNTNVDVPNNAFGTQNAHSGVGYFGFASYYQSTPEFREYTYCTFTAPMVAGTTYDISFWVSLSDNSQYGSDNGLQLKFTNNIISGPGGNWNPLTTITPDIVNTVMLTDQTNWVQVSYQYVAAGGEQYMTIGNFYDDANTNTNYVGANTYSTVYFYVDDFIVEPVTVACDPAWTTTTACSTDPAINLDALITGDTGGTWSGTGVTGNMFDPSSGSQSVTYTAPGGCDSTQTISVTTTSVATWTIPTGLCDGDAPIDLSTFVTGTAGGTWSGTGVTGTMFDPSVGTQSITYSAGTAPCDDAMAQTITVGTQASAAWNPPTGLCLAAGQVDLNTTITGTAGGTWSGTGVTGSMFDPSVGTQSITYTVGSAPCDDVSTQTINVTPNGDASWTIPTNLCIGDAPIDLSAFVTGSAGGTWSGTGITGNMFDPSVGTQSISYSVGVAPCDDMVTQTINVATSLDASWTIPTNICETDAPIDMSAFITGDTGGTWSGTGVTGNMFDPSVGTQTLTYTVGTGGCQATSAQSVSVDLTPDPSWIPTTACISGAPVDMNTTLTGTTGGTWSGNGISGNDFDPSVGTQALTYTVTQGACTANSTQSVNVLDPAPASTPTHVSCFGLTDGAAATTVTGGSGNYTYTWNPSGQTTANPNGLAAGTYIVTITDVDAGCSVIDSVTILEPAEIELNMSGLDACAPEMGTAMVQASGGSGAFTYDWGALSSTTNTVTDVDSTTATVVVTDANGCTATDSVFVNVWPIPITTISNDTTIYSGDFVQLNATGGVVYEWSPSTYLSCEDCANPVASPEETTSYCVNITDARGCFKEECVLIDIEIVCGDIFVPSAFSPNDDGENDELCVYSDCLEDFVFVVYNRWGEKVYETSNMQICWDGTWKGKQLNSAVFVYTLDGSLINGQTVQQKGNISLIR